MQSCQGPQTIEHEARLRSARWRSSPTFTWLVRPRYSGPGLVDRAVTTLTYVAGDEPKAAASLFNL